MTNAEVIQTMTVAELTLFLQVWEDGDIDYAITFCDMCKNDRECKDCLNDWLKADSQGYGGLLTDNMKKYWKVHDE